MIWKMATEHAFPGSKYLAPVDPRFNIPIRALIAFFVVNVFIGLLEIGSNLAFYAILSGGGVALQVSYLIPIACVMFRGRDKLLPPGRKTLNLGNFWGYTVNAASLLWSTIVVILYVFPSICLW